MKSCVPISWLLVPSAKIGERFEITPISPLTVTVVLKLGGNQHDGCSLGGVTNTAAEGSQTPGGNSRLEGSVCLRWSKGKMSFKTKMVEAGD